MEKTVSLPNVNVLPYLCAFVCLFASFPLNSCELCSEEEITNYSELGEYEDVYKEFERQLDAEDQYEAQGICKNIKRWLKKRVVKIVKKFVDPRVLKDPEFCAYTAAKFKRKMKKFCRSTNIEEVLSQFPDDPKFTGLNKFKDRIRHYHYNKHAKPPRHPDYDRYCFKMGWDDLEDVPERALFGGVEVFCGTIIALIPFPGCAYLGGFLATHGASQIYEGYMQQHEKSLKNTNLNASDQFIQDPLIRLNNNNFYKRGVSYAAKR